MKQYLLYILRWQLGTPILALIMIYFSNLHLNTWYIVFLTNLIGALIFFWIDKLIFKNK